MKMPLLMGARRQWCCRFAQAWSSGLKKTPRSRGTSGALKGSQVGSEPACARSVHMSLVCVCSSSHAMSYK